MTDLAQAPDTVDLYNRVHQFYAAQMQLLDARATDEWAATFTEDGTFDASGLPEPAHGRAAIAKGARAAAEQSARTQVQNRHWIGMLAVRPGTDGTVSTRCYALVLQIPRGGSPTIFRSTVCEDVLVPAGRSWQVRHRRVTRDDLG